MRMRIGRSVVLVSVVTMLAAGALVNEARAQGDPPPAVPGGKSVTTALYTVKDGNQVDPKTLAGWKTWRAMACERCHGASQEGLVGPALVNSLKVLTKDQFHTTITQGRLEKGMPNFGGVKLVNDTWEDLYAYLKGRSDGNIAAGHLYPIQADQKSAKK